MSSPVSGEPERPLTVEPLVSVIVVSYNRVEDLRLCLSAIVGSDGPGVEVIVVDNASTDAAPRVAASFDRVTLVQNESNVGFAGATNQGLALARGKYVALINNDAVVAPDYFRELVSFLESRPDCAAAGGKAFLWDDEHPLGDRRGPYYADTLINADSGRNRATIGAPDCLHEVATLSGCAVVLRRQAIEEIGGGFLDATFFMYYEETDFFARAIRRGWKLYYLGEPAVWHRVRAGTSDSPYHYLYYMERNRILYAWRNFDAPELEALRRTLGARIRREWFWRVLRGLLPMSVERAARGDAWRWYLQNRSLLDAQRRALAGFPGSYNQTVREIQARTIFCRQVLPQVVALIPLGAEQVVHVGRNAACVSTAIRKARPAAQVRGLEIAPAPAPADCAVLEGAVAGQAEDPAPSTWPRPDCVVMADLTALEPGSETLLRSWSLRLAPGGCVVAAVAREPRGGSPSSRPAGRQNHRQTDAPGPPRLGPITWMSLARWVESCGLSVVAVKRILEAPAKVPGRRFVLRWAVRAADREAIRGGPRWRRILLDACTVRYLVVAKAKDPLP